MGNRVLTGEQLIENLQESRNKKVFSVIGHVKLQDDESKETILFCTGNRTEKWLPIPVSMLDSVEILGKTFQNGKIVNSAQLFLKKPSSEEGAFLADVINFIGQSNELSTGGENTGTGNLPAAGQDQRDRVFMGINDTTLPLDISGITGIQQNLRFINPVIWLASWQVGNG